MQRLESSIYQLGIEGFKICRVAQLMHRECSLAILTSFLHFYHLFLFLSNLQVFVRRHMNCKGISKKVPLYRGTTRNTVIRCALLKAVHLEPLPDHISTVVHNLNHY
jgi:hypothetical protein